MWWGNCTWGELSYWLWFRIEQVWIVEVGKYLHSELIFYTSCDDKSFFVILCNNYTGIGGSAFR